MYVEQEKPVEVAALAPGLTSEQIKDATKHFLAMSLATELHDLVRRYGDLIKHTGGMTRNSMIYAYSRGIHDAIQFIQKQKEE